MAIPGIQGTKGPDGEDDEIVYQTGSLNLVVYVIYGVCISTGATCLVTQGGSFLLPV